MPSEIITFVGISFIFLYGAVSILEFYGMNVSSYGVYIVFYAFMLLSYVVLS